MHFRKTGHLNQRLLNPTLVGARMDVLIDFYCIVLLLFLSDPFRGMWAWRKAMGPQKPGNSPGPGPEVVERQRVAKESVAGQCRMR